MPGVLYGSGAPRAFAIGERDLRRALSGEHGMNAILDVVVDGEAKPHHAVLKDYQLDPLRSTLVHVDLHEIRLDRPIHTQVGVELVGTPEGVTRGGILSQIVREVTVEALPMEIPDRLELDVSGLDIGDNLRVADLEAPAGVSLLDDPEVVLASVLAPRLAEPEEEEVEEEGEEAEAEAAEGEAAPEGEGAAEPESSSE